MSETGALPSGVTFVDNGNGTATLSGTPAPNSGGAYDLTITSSNTTGTTAQSFVLYVDQAPAITSANTATFMYNESGSFDVTTTGYPNVSCSETGALPNGVTFAPSGALAGTPSQFGTFDFNIDCTNGYGTDATQSFSLVVDAPPAFSTGSSATFTASSSGSFTVSAVGYPSPSFSESGVLPSGVTFVDNGNGSATLSGTPGASSGGSYTFNIIASNTVANTTDSFTLTVDAAPVFTSPNTVSVNAGAAFSETVTTADGYPVPTMATTTTLPSGVTFTDNGNGTGTLSGTLPDTDANTTIPLTFTAAGDTGGTVSQTVDLVVAAPTSEALGFTSGSTATFTAGANGSFPGADLGDIAAVHFGDGRAPAGIALCRQRGRHGIVFGNAECRRWWHLQPRDCRCLRHVERDSVLRSDC